MYYDEWNQFCEPVAQKWFVLVSRLPEPCTLHFVNPFAHPNVAFLALAGENDKLLVRFPWSHKVHGVPLRNPRHLREQVALAAGQWLQLRVNGTFLAKGLFGYDGTRYYKLVDNIGIVDSFVPTLFVSGPPDYQISNFRPLR